MKILQRSKITIFFIAIFFILFIAASVKAVSFGDITDFYIDSNYDASARSQIKATLVKTSQNLYFYVEKSWWDSQVPAKQNEILYQELVSKN